MHITLLYAALLGLLFVLLSIRTLLLRRTLRIAIGDAGNESMLRAMRVHGNFAEYVPLSLLLIYLVEVTGASPLYVHVLGAAVIAGRVSHALGVSRLKENYAFRIAGMTLTLAPIIVASLRLLRVFLAQDVA
jgi:uncharacterized membrane protein YecN with MAPEG domain